MMNTDQRRRRMAEILARNRVATQEQLQALLEADGIAATQSTVSRDLRELGYRKTAAGYVSVATGSGGGSLVAGNEPSRSRRRFVASLEGLILNVERGGTLVVITTRTGQAQIVATALRTSGMSEILGTIASADTIFVATQTAAQARALHRTLRSAVRPA